MFRLPSLRGPTSNSGARQARLRRGIGAAAIALGAAAAATLAAYWVALRPVPVAAVAAIEAAVPFRVTGPGTVQARIPVTLSARITATIVELKADQGDSVKRGQLLARLDDRELAAKRSAVGESQETVRQNVAVAEAATAKARADLELARSKHERDRGLSAKGYVSEAALDGSIAALRVAEAGLASAEATLAARRSEARSVEQEVRYAETVLSHTAIVAPMDSVVIERLAEVGSTVVPGTPVFKLVNPATIWVTARIDESVVGRVDRGMRATIRLRTGEVVSGTVARIARQSDAATRELEVDVAFDAPPARFAIDQEAEVTILAGEERGPAVPLAALIRSTGKQGVLVVRDGRAEFMPVETAAADATRVVIAKGLAAGDLVIVAPQSVKPGARVRVTATAGPANVAGW
jgi:RND family efflux transporter MFP subunit